MAEQMKFEYGTLGIASLFINESIEFNYNQGGLLVVFSSQGISGSFQTTYGGLYPVGKVRRVSVDGDESNSDSSGTTRTTLIDISFIEGGKLKITKVGAMGSSDVNYIFLGT